jgi:hypothetical protein
MIVMHIYVMYIYFLVSTNRNTLAIVKWCLLWILQADWLISLEQHLLYLITWVGIVTLPMYIHVPVHVFYKEIQIDRKLILIVIFFFLENIGYQLRKRKSYKQKVVILYFSYTNIKICIMLLSQEYLKGHYLPKS